MKQNELHMAVLLLKRVEKEYPALFRHGELVHVWESSQDKSPTRVKDEIRLIRRLLLEVSKEL